MTGTLGESSARLREMLHERRGVFFVLDPRGVVLHAEGPGLEPLGRDPGLGRSALDLYADAPWLVDLVRRALEGQAASGAGPVRGRIAEMSVAPVRDAEGRLLAAVGFAADVTQERAERAALRTERDLSAAVLDTAGALVVVLDREGRVVRFNRACERTTGWGFEEMRGRPIWDLLLLPEEREPVRRVFAELADGRFPSTFENYWLARDGSRRLIAWSNTALLGEGDRVEYVIGTGIDVTEARRAEAELKRQAARLAALADASRAFASGLDHRSVLETVVKLLAELVGDCCLLRTISEDGLLLETVSFWHRDPRRGALIRAAHLAAPQRVDEGVTAQVLATGQSLLIPELTPERIRAEMKPEYWHYLDSVRSVLIAPLTARGRTFGHVTMLRDAPGPPYTHEDRTFLEDLAVRAAESVENARLYATAQAAVAARDEFLSIASHELRTPLAALKLALQNLRRMLGATAGAAARRSLEAGERQTGRLETLVAALLDVSRIQAGRLDLSLETVDLSALVHETVAQFEEQLALCGCKVTVRAPAPVEGRWDRLRLGQVVVNLLSNAMKYGEGQPIELEVEGDGRQARLSVSDHGIGLPPEAQRRIFQRFVRAVSSRNYGGLGLGLYIARRLAEAHGGTLGVHSQPGEGSTFTLELPVAGPPPAAPPPTPTPG
ncbi:MAG TPA: ATP-binding protein [Anaeromyxobacteraceae bacterium]|nr:ATP-binding protein [Anaeromyxobacteraceae bacterium]